MLPSEEKMELLALIRSHPEGITTPQIITEYYGEVPDWKIAPLRTRVYQRCKVLAKCEEIKREPNPKGTRWFPL